MKTIGIYPGNFQPPTRSHYQVYRRLRQMVGTDVFIITTDRTPTPDAPLNYGDKEQIWVRHGAPAGHVVKVQNWKHPSEIFNNFSPTHTKVIFALNPKEAETLSKKKGRAGQVHITGIEKPQDLAYPHPHSVNEDFASEEPQADPEVDPDTEEPEEDPEAQFTKHQGKEDENKEVWLSHEGKLSYFQPYKGNENSMKPLSEHGYVLIVDDTRIEGKPISTGNIRQILGSTRYNDDEKKKFFRFVFGWFDISLYKLMQVKFRMAHQVSLPDEEQPAPMPSMKSMISTTQPHNPVSPSNAPRTSNLRNGLQRMVREILGEIMDEDYSSTMNAGGTDQTTTDMASSLDQEKSPAQQRSDDMKKKQDLLKQKQAAERDMDGLQKDLKWKQSDILRKRKDELPAKRKELDTLNKQISQPPSSISAMS